MPKKNVSFRCVGNAISFVGLCCKRVGWRLTRVAITEDLGGGGGGGKGGLGGGHVPESRRGRRTTKEESFTSPPPFPLYAQSHLLSLERKRESPI